MSKKTDIPKNMLIFDAHCDTANVLYDQSSYFIKEKDSHFTLSKAQKGGLQGQIFALYVNPVYAPYRSIKKALVLYTTLEKRLFSSSNTMKVTSTAEMKSALQQNKLACWLSLESGHIIENSIEILEFFYHLGIRVLTLTHTKNTDWADSSGDKPEHDGLTSLGEKIIRKMNELNMVIDVSHSSDLTVEDVLDVSTMPCMASHSCVRALCDVPRNLSDDLIREIAQKNGYIGVNFYPGFLNKKIYDHVIKNMKKHTEWFEKKVEENENNPDMINKIEMELNLKIVDGIDTVDVNHIIDHINHIVDIGGIDCVGLGSDFDGIPATPTDLSDVSCYPTLVNGLMQKGFSDGEIEQIMGLNLFHFLQQFDH